MAKLTDKAVQNAAPGPKRKEIPDAAMPGLYMLLQPTGAKSWAYRFRFGGKTRKLTLGRYPKVGLAGARKLAREAELEIRQGKDPAQAKVAAQRKTATVEELCRDFISIYAKEHTRPRSLHEMARILGLEFDDSGELRPTKSRGEVLSKWKDRSVQDITSEDIINLIDAIAARGARIGANRALTVLRSMFGWGVSRKRLKASPCDGLKPPSKENKRRRVLKPHELRALWRSAEYLDGQGAYRPRRDAYRLLILSGQRKSQVCLAKLEDFDLQERTWTIPPGTEGSKGDEPHVLPITPKIEEIVKACPYQRGYLFSTTAGTRSLHLGDKIKKRIDALMLGELRKEAKERGDDPAEMKLEPWTNHDLRRSMRTGLSALAVPEGDLVRELVIGHKQPGVHSVYDQYTYIPQMRVALELWEAKVRDMVSPPPSNVVLLKTAAGG